MELGRGLRASGTSVIVRRCQQRGRGLSQYGSPHRLRSEVDNLYYDNDPLCALTYDVALSPYLDRELGHQEGEGGSTTSLLGTSVALSTPMWPYPRRGLGPKTAHQPRNQRPHDRLHEGQQLGRRFGRIGGSPPSGGRGTPFCLPCPPGPLA